MGLVNDGLRHALRRLRNEWLLLVFAGLAVVLAVCDPRGAPDYGQWLQVPALAGLVGLMVAIQGIHDSGMVQRAAAMLLARVHSQRGAGLLLVATAALLATVLTNDVSLFLVVPLTLAIGRHSRVPVGRMVALEALAVNAGSALSPIGNPQNLLLWHHTGLSFPAFVLAMLPAAAVMFALLGMLTWWWLPQARVHLDATQLEGQPVAPRRALLGAAALLAMVLSMEFHLALAGAAVVLAVFALLARDSLKRTDWLLLLTFAAIFVALGHVAALPVVQHAMAHLDVHRPPVVFAAGILASQAISNVPATVLLLDRVPDAIALAVAVNLGGFGLAIGSLANLIALRLARQPRMLRQLHQVSIPFLLVCAPLAWLAWRWLG